MHQAIRFRLKTRALLISGCVLVSVYAQDCIGKGTLTSHSIDTARHGSGIKSIIPTKTSISNLAKLGMLWGFVKYYHADVQGGGIDMDSALFAVLPKVVVARTTNELNTILEKWVDAFGKPQLCNSCRRLNEMKDVALKPDFDFLIQEFKSSPSLSRKLEYIYTNRYQAPRFLLKLGIRPLSGESKTARHYVDLTPGVGNPVFTNENAYKDDLYPDAGIRLLTLFRYWNMIQYFYPYRDLITGDWKKVLEEMIPEFVEAKDVTAYQLAALKLTVRISDSHAGIWNGGSKIQEYKGRLITPFCAQFIEGKPVILGYYKDTLGVKAKIQRGDVIERIDGRSISDIVRHFLPYTPGSNYPTQLRNMIGWNGFLLRSNKPIAQIEITRDNKLQTVIIPRIPVEGRFAIKDFDFERSDVGYKILPGNIGYLYPLRLTNNSLDSVITLLGSTKGLIIDLRCYPRTFMPFSYGGWLKPRQTPFVRFTTGSTDLPGLFVRTPALENGFDNQESYKGKVVILVNETTQSQAEYTAMALQTVPGAITIGSTTAGADGNVSRILLPGGLETMISGIGVLYLDGTETQRKGIKIDKIVLPTIKGIRDGRDEILQAAVELINKSR